MNVWSGNEDVLEQGGRMHWISTPVKFLIESSNEVPVGIGSGDTPVKRSDRVAFTSDEQEEALCQEQSARK